MELRGHFYVAVIVACTAILCLTIANPILDVEDLSLEYQKILKDCENSDYRVYITCLKRQKRHHSVPTEIDHHCLESCFQMNKCTHESIECHKQCSYCLKRTKHKTSIITEFESECTSASCNKTSETNEKPINITTIIDVHNHHNISSPGNTPPYRPLNPIAVLPEIGIRFTAASIRCIFVACEPAPLVTSVIPSMLDCSGCGNLLTLIRCDVRCNTTDPCISPSCVGGIRG